MKGCPLLPEKNLGDLLFSEGKCRGGSKGGGGGKRSEERTNFSQDVMYEKINTFNFFKKEKSHRRH